MPCLVINIDPYKNEIIELFENYHMLSQILQYLLKHHLVHIGQSTLQRCLLQWNIHQQVQTWDLKELQLQIIVLTYASYFNNADTLNALLKKDFEIGQIKLVQIRKSMGIIRRISIFDKKTTNAELLTLVE